MGLLSKIFGPKNVTDNEVKSYILSISGKLGSLRQSIHEAELDHILTHSQDLLRGIANPTSCYRNEITVDEFNDMNAIMEYLLQKVSQTAKEQQIKSFTSYNAFMCRYMNEFVSRATSLAMIKENMNRCKKDKNRYEKYEQEYEDARQTSNADRDKYIKYLDLKANNESYEIKISAEEAKCTELEIVKYNVEERQKRIASLLDSGRCSLFEIAELKSEQERNNTELKRVGNELIRRRDLIKTMRMQLLPLNEYEVISEIDETLSGVMKNSQFTGDMLIQQFYKTLSSVKDIEKDVTRTADTIEAIKKSIG